MKRHRYYFAWTRPSAKGRLHAVGDLARSGDPAVCGAQHAGVVTPRLEFDPSNVSACGSCCRVLAR